MEKIRKQYTFTGHVQGVGFRYSAQYLAQAIGVTGWVKNEWDGTVVMEAQGTRPQSCTLGSKPPTTYFASYIALPQATYRRPPIGSETPVVV